MKAVDHGHEPLVADDDVVEASPRSFGLTLGVLFALYAVWPLWHGRPIRIWAVALSTGLLVSGAFAPRVLGPAARAWQKLGLLLHRIVNPIVMGILFYGAVTPFGVVMRWRRSDWAKRFRKDPEAATYWLARSDPPGSMMRQF
jgi:hypothetical protein